MKTIIALSRKGGTTKTTTCYAIGAGLRKQGKRVLFVDLDGQANLTISTGANENELNTYDILCNGANILDAIQQTEQGNIIAGNELLHVGERSLSGADDAFRLKKALEAVKRQYDYCIIDTPPALGMLTINAIVAADKIIVPVQADLYSLQGIPRIINTLESVKDLCGVKRKIDGLLLTMFDPRPRVTRQIVEDMANIAKHYGTRIYNAKIRKCTALVEAELQQQNIFDYAPRSNAAKDYMDLVNEIV